MQKTIFITWWSWFLWINLVRFFLKKWFNIISYDLLEFDYPEKDKIKHIVGDIRNIDLLIKSMKWSNIVIHSAAALPLYSKKEIMTTDVEWVKNVLDSAKINNIERVIHISSTAVYWIPDHHPLYEYDKLIWVWPYWEAKILAENECIKKKRMNDCFNNKTKIIYLRRKIMSICFILWLGKRLT